MVVIYEWEAWDDYLIRHVLPRATRLTARLQDTADGVWRRMPRGASSLYFHLNLSRTRLMPRNRARFVAQVRRAGVAIYNGVATDITKRHIQAVCRRTGLQSCSAQFGGDPRELLIVKSNSNYGAETERGVTGRDRRTLGLPPKSRIVKSANGYRVMPRAEIPRRWWQNSALAIETFVSNSEGLHVRCYIHRTRCVISEAWCSEQIKKMEIGIERRNRLLSLREVAKHGLVPKRRTLLQRVSHQLLGAIRAFALDFGAVDFVVDDNGECYLVDVNTTPYWGDETQPGMIEFLSGRWGNSKGRSGP